MVQHHIINTIVLWLLVTHGELRSKNGTRSLGGGLQGGDGYTGSSGNTVTGGTQTKGGQSGVNSSGKIYNEADFGIAGRGTGGTYGTSREGGNGWYGGRLRRLWKCTKLILRRWRTDQALF